MRSLSFDLLLLISFVSFIGGAVKFTLTIPGLQKKCFYEMLGNSFDRNRIDTKIFFRDNSQK